MKAITKDGIKSFNYDSESRIIDLKDTYIFAKPRNDEGNTLPEEYVSKEEYSYIWLVPFMYPFMRFKYKTVQEKADWGNYQRLEGERVKQMNIKIEKKNDDFKNASNPRIVPKEEFKFPKTANLDYVMLDMLESKQIQTDLATLYGSKTMVENMIEYLNDGRIQIGKENAIKDNQ